MKIFISKYSYSCLRMFVTQIAISIFGFSLAIAVGDLSYPLQYTVSICATLFYLVLIYSIPWKHGNEDGLSVEYGRLKRNMLTGLYMGLTANSINIILALVSCVLYFVGQKVGYSLLNTFGVMLQGMYAGILTVKIGYFPLNSFPWTFILTTIPAVVTSTLAYMAGYANFRVFKFKDKR